VVDRRVVDVVSAPAYDRWGVTVYKGDCLDVLRQFPDGHFSAVVTDPPYSYRFMNRSWDAHESPLVFQRWCEGWARECLRVLKPGGMMLAFGGTRTFHRLTCGIEDAGFEIRDSIDSLGMRISWVHSQGMPKGINISKQIDKMAGAEREVIGRYQHPGEKPGWSENPSCNEPRSSQTTYGVYATRVGNVTAPATDAARQWEGWNTQLRPSHEPIICARKPFPGTVAGNVLAHGTGGLHVDACRVSTADGDYAHPGNENRKHTDTAYGYCEHEGRQAPPHSGGRWPSNVVLSHAPSVDPATGEVVGDACAQGCVDGCPVRELTTQGGERASWMAKTNGTIATANDVYGKFGSRLVGPQNQYGDSGSAARFFPCFRFEAKAPTAERPRVWTAPTTKLRLREDLTEQERDHVLSELRRVGVDVS
jgi:site-specific DNA-methyltransferase (adenine-specific)